MSHLPEDKELSRKRRRGKRQQKASQRNGDSRRQAGNCVLTGERETTHTQAPRRQECREGVGRERNSV